MDRLCVDHLVSPQMDEEEVQALVLLPKEDILLATPIPIADPNRAGRLDTSCPWYEDELLDV